MMAIPLAILSVFWANNAVSNQALAAVGPWPDKQSANRVGLLDDPELRVGSGEVAPGDLITVPVTADLDGEALGAATIEITYDPTVINATGCAADPDDLFDSALCNTAAASDTVKLTAVSVGGVSGGLALADVSFLAVGEVGDTSPLTLTVDPFADPDGQPISHTLEHGRIDIVPPFSVYLPLALRSP